MDNARSHPRRPRLGAQHRIKRLDGKARAVSGKVMPFSAAQIVWPKTSGDWSEETLLRYATRLAIAGVNLGSPLVAK